MDFVGWDGVRLIEDSIDARMHEGKMRCIHEILDRAISGPKFVRAAQYLLVAGVIPLGKLRYLAFGRSEAGPYKAIFFRGFVRNGASLLKRRLIRCRRHQHASRRPVIIPAMVGADDLVGADEALR